MECRLPRLIDKELLSKYVQEHFDNNETSISASLGLSKMEYSDWVEKINNNVTIGDEEFGKIHCIFDLTMMN